MKTLVLLNAKAGTLITGAVENPGGVVEQAFAAAGRPAQVDLVEPEEMDARLEAAAKADWETVIVGGGDGSFSHALAKLAHCGKVLGLLPLGTMNLLGRDMYAQTDDLAASAAALAGGEVQNLDLATLNGRPFHTLCGLGYFSRVARQREQNRFDFVGGRLLSVIVSVFRSVTKTGRMRLDIEVDGRRISARAYAVLVTSNRVGNDWRRQRLDEGVLELHLMRHSHLRGRARAGFEMIAGRWREGEAIESMTGRRIVLRSGRPRIWVAVDGELNREETPLTFAIEHARVPVLMPRRT
jgi:diacylglycerol kinase family enzyme